MSDALVAAVPLFSVADEALIEVLKSRGYRVVKEREDEWVTLSMLARRIGRSTGSLSRTIRNAGGRPPGLEIERALKGYGRIGRVRASQEFFQWLQKGGGNE